MENRQDQLAAAALRRLELLERREAFDPVNLSSRPTFIQQEFIDDFSTCHQQWIRAGNQSGKSQTCARVVTWVMTDTHPAWNRPTSWGDEPLLCIVAGRTGKQIEDSLLPKLRSYLDPGSYKEVRIGNIIQRLELTNGNRFVFQSLENPEVARERLQSYVAHITWVDELPPTMGIVREILIRTQARNGYNLFSFTPTVVNVEIQRYVDAMSLPEGKVYRFNMLDNPLYSDPVRRAELMARYAHLPEHVRNAIFNGDWMSNEDQVYYFNYAEMVESPQDYSPTTWRHVESVDPALKSALGLTVWAENPVSGVWYCIMAEYIRGIYVPTDLVAAVKKKTERFNIVRRISDPHEVWYIQTAASMGINYQGVYKKTERLSELIKGLQSVLGPRCKISYNCPDLISELQEQRFSDKADGKIVNASKFHLIDSAKYFADNIPAAEKRIISSSWDEWLLKANDQRKLSEDKKKKKLEAIQVRRRPGGGRSQWKRAR